MTEINPIARDLISHLCCRQYVHKFFDIAIELIILDRHWQEPIVDIGIPFVIAVNGLVVLHPVLFLDVSQDRFQILAVLVELLVPAIMLLKLFLFLKGHRVFVFLGLRLALSQTTEACQVILEPG